MRHPLRVALSLALLAAFALSTAPAHAQRYLSLRVEGGVPTGDFEDQVEDIGFGVAGQLLFHLHPVPVAFGFEGSFLNYGRQVDTLPVQFADDGSASLAEFVTHNNISSLGAVVRLQPGGGAIQPYAEGFGGFNYFHTRTSLEETVVVNDGSVLGGTPVLVNRNPGDTVVDDFAFTYGGGGGFLIRLYKGEDDGHPVEAYLDVGARYLLGEEADYLVEADDATTEVAPLRSTTDLIRSHIGLSFRF